MTRTTGFCLTLLGACVAAIPTAAHATDEDAQLWFTGYLNFPVADEVSGQLQITQRFREGANQVLLRGSADFSVSDAVSLNGGAVYSEAGGTSEFRLQQQVTLTTGPVDFRTRLEERFFEGADRMDLRLRERVRVTVPVASGLRAAFSAELLYIARSRDADGDDHVDQWRLNAALTRRFSDHFDAGIGYLFIAAPRSGEPDRVSHVTELTLTYRI